MQDFKEYLDQVKAEEVLKEKTKAFVRNVYTDNGVKKSTMNSKNSIKRRDFAMKRLIISIAACALIMFGGYNFYKMPVNYISLDINPSVELGINAFNRVVSTEGINEDGKALLQQNNFTNMSTENAVAELVGEAAEQGFVAEDGSTVIAITAQSKNEAKAVKLKDKSRDKVQFLLGEKDMAAIVYADCSSLELRTKARELGLSPGKYRLLSILQSLDPSINIEQYKYAKVTEIIAKTNELLLSAGTNGVKAMEYENACEMINTAAQQIQEANGTMEQAQIRNREQNQEQNPSAGEQVQTQTQNQNMGTSAGDQQQIQTQTQTQTQTPTQTQGGGDQSTSGSGNGQMGGNTNRN